jgi:hypothetical protein
MEKRANNTTTKQRLAATILLSVGLLLGGVALADTAEDYLIQSEKTTSFNWTQTDGAGMQWDIRNTGAVHDGTNDTYDTGMQLTVNGRTVTSSKGILGRNGQEVQIDSADDSGLTIHRRIYVDRETGYCRWVEIFRNRTSSPQPVKAEWRTQLGNQYTNLHTTTDGASLTDKDWAFVTANPQDNHRPTTAHFFGNRLAGKTMNVELRNQREILYSLELTVPPGQTRAVCLIEFQRTSETAARDLLKTFRPERALRNLPPALRDSIVNIRGTITEIDDLLLPRTPSADLIIMQDGTEHKGWVQEEQFVVHTSLGNCTLPAEDVIGLVVTDPRINQVAVAMRDGQVVRGTIKKISMTYGPVGRSSTETLSLRSIQSIGFAVSPGKPEQISTAANLACFPSGLRLAFDPPESLGQFMTEYGAIELKPDRLRELRFQGDTGGMHRVVLADGSTLSGLMTTPRFRLRLALSEDPLDANPFMLTRLVLPTPTNRPHSTWTLTLHNGDRLYVTFPNDTVELVGKSRPPWNILKYCRRMENSETRYEVALMTGETFQGRFAAKSIDVVLAPCGTMTIPTTHIQDIVPTPRDDSPAKKATSQPRRDSGRGNKTDPPESQPVAPASGPASRPGPAP